MGVPVTTGSLRTTLASMGIGDYIITKYVAASAAVGVFSEFGTSVAAEIPVAGASVPSGTFYFIKVSQGLLIADRTIQHSISWDTLNAGKVIQGKAQIFDSASGFIRTLSGGVAYADVTVNMVVVAPAPQLGGFPTNSDYDKYLIQSTLDGKITANNINTWHHDTLKIWTQDTPAIAIAPATNRIGRGGAVTTKDLNWVAANTAPISYGFRPVFEY